MYKIDSSILKLLICPDCKNDLELGAERHPTLVCTECRHSFAIIDGIPDLSPKDKHPTTGVYRTDTLNNVVAGVYDFAAPLASITTWRCSPLRYIDATHIAVGQANHGLLVSAPIGTGFVLDRVLSSYHDLTIIGFDSSWEMLRQAQKRFAKRKDVKVHLIHCDLQIIPIKSGCADAVQSLNGLHSTVHRIEMLNNFSRIGKEGASISGSALVRGVAFTADAALNQLEKWGIIPILRTSEFLLREMENSSLGEIRFTTSGAVLFWEARAGGKEETCSLKAASV